MGNSLQNVRFASNGGTAHGYLVVPEGGSGPGVVVIQEWWGLTSHIGDVANRLAAEGFVALAPDLYGGATTHDADEAGRLMQELPVDQAARDLGGAVDYLLASDAVTSSTVGVVGFCMGGGFALVLAAQQGDKIGAAVILDEGSPLRGRFLCARWCLRRQEQRRDGQQEEHDAAERRPPGRFLPRPRHPHNEQPEVDGPGGQRLRKGHTHPRSPRGEARSGAHAHDEQEPHDLP